MHYIELDERCSDCGAKLRQIYAERTQPGGSVEQQHMGPPRCIDHGVPVHHKVRSPGFETVVK